MARTCVVLADASKFARVEPGFVFGLEDVDVLVTDSAVAPGVLDAVRGRGVEVIVAAGGAAPAETETASRARAPEVR
jgi:DeoR/GlpR family transcriptional regulator of sugar metabolism